MLTKATFFPTLSAGLVPVLLEHNMISVKKITSSNRCNIKVYYTCTSTLVSSSDRSKVRT